MPRTARASAAGVCYHVLNRGNAQAEVFHKPDDFDAFVTLQALAVERTAMRVLAFCLMPNHLHLVLWPRKQGALSRFMRAARRMGASDGQSRPRRASASSRPFDPGGDPE